MTQIPAPPNTDGSIREWQRADKLAAFIRELYQLETEENETVMLLDLFGIMAFWTFGFQDVRVDVENAAVHDGPRRMIMRAVTAVGNTIEVGAAVQGGAMAEYIDAFSDMVMELSTSAENTTVYFMDGVIPGNGKLTQAEILAAADLKKRIVVGDFSKENIERSLDYASQPFEIFDDRYDPDTQERQIFVIAKKGLDRE